MYIPHKIPDAPRDGLQKPTRISQYPRYLLRVLSGFFSRLFYILSLVWQAAPVMLILMLLICIIDGLLPVVGAYISKELLNGVADMIGSTATDSLRDDIFIIMKPLAILFVAYFIYLFLKRIISHVSTTVTNITGELVTNHIKVKIIEKAKTVDLASFDSPEFYEKLENANREAGMRPVHILTATFNIASYVISTVSFVIVLASLSPLAPIIIICAALPGAAVNFVYRRKSYRYIRHHSKERRAMNYYSALMTDKDMAKEIRITGIGDTLIARYKKVFRSYYLGLRRLMLREGITRTVVGLLAAAASCAMFFYVAYTIVFGNGEIGDYSLYTSALTSIAGYVTSIMNSSAQIYEGTLFINNMMDFMAEEPKIVPASEPISPTRGTPHTVEFRNVSFRYPGTEKNVIENLNLTLKTPDSVVLVGLNGAGKTTLIKLLTRLYDPTEGCILFDGVDIRNYAPEELYNLFGIIFQDYGKYAESAADNIIFGDVSRTAGREEVVSAAQSAGADEFIEKLPSGYDTPLTRLFSEDGIELSGGQWQKLSVARAFYKDSDILILDEPTAALDAIAEKEVFDSFTTLAKDKLTVFVSHRLSGAVTASKIVVLNNGRVTELGTHDELMSLHGEYYNLFTTQASRYK